MSNDGGPQNSALSQGDTQLDRALGVRQLSAAIFNYTVGSGIFRLPALAILQLGAAAPLAYFVCMIVMGLVLLCFAEAGSRVSLTGGPYAYVETALGPFVGFIAGVMLVLTGVSAGAGVAVLFANSATALIPNAPAWLPKIFIVGVVLLFVTTNIRGVRNSAKLIEFITIAKLLPLLAFVIIGVAFITPANLKWNHTPDLSTVLSTAGIVIFAFSGIESALAPSGEIHNPSRTVPLAAFIALSAATVLYLAIQWVALGVAGLGLGTSPVPLADAASVFAGSLGRSVLIVGATISMLGYLSSNILSVPRSIYALARDGFLFKFLGSIHERFRTPHLAIVVYGTCIGALALTGTFESLAIFANITAFILYILCAIAVWRLRALDIRGDGKPFLIPGGPLIPLATVGVNVWLITKTGTKGDFLGMAGVLLIALVLYGIRTYRLQSAAQSNTLNN